MATGTSAGQTRGFLDNLGDFALDFGRSVLIDTEVPADDNNVPDRVDVRTGNVNSQDVVGGNFQVNRQTGFLGGLSPAMKIGGGVVLGILSLLVIKKLL